MQKILPQRANLHRQLENQESVNDELRSKLQHFESLANIGMISAMVAHEINNILTPLGSYAELALQNPEDEYIKSKAIEKAAKNSQRAAKIPSTMMDFAAGMEQPKDNCSLKAIIDETFTCLARDFKKDSIRVSIEIQEEFQIYCEETSIQQVFMNLILNAREAMLKRGGSLRFSAEKIENYTNIIVEDSGEGIERENLKKIFTPFFTTKSREDKRHNAGTGLGLAFCEKIIEAHEGSISVESKVGEGTKFTISLPIKD